MKNNNNEENKIDVNKFSQFISDLLLLPIWVKQLLYVYLRYRLEEELTAQYLNSYEIEDIFQLHKTTVTYKGKKELENKSLNLAANHYTFIKESLDGLTIAELTIKNNWNLYEVSTMFIECLEKELISTPQSLKMVELIRYMSGKIRLGEYFLRTGQITMEQLEEVLEQQEKIKKATGEQVGSATVLVNMGYVPESEIKAVLRYKEESRKRFSMDNVLNLSSNIQSNDDVVSLQATNEKLMKENKILKLQLRKLLNLS